MKSDVFHERYWGNEGARPDDERDEFQRDKARIIHSAAFRRLQAKTQVTGTDEGDFHRTRLTHSIEVAQIGEGLVDALAQRTSTSIEAKDWLPSRDLIAAACLAHDLGHPPFGHGGEVALHASMKDHGGFEGNGQTLRILTRLEKYRSHNQGMNPTRRLILAVLKYPIEYSKTDKKLRIDNPQKCFFDTETEIVDWALSKEFLTGEISTFRTVRNSQGNSNIGGSESSGVYLKSFSKTPSV